MKNNLPFDDFVREQLSTYTPDVPGHIWENIVAKRKSRPKGFWWSLSSGKYIMLAGLALIISAGTYYFISSGNNNNTNNTIANNNNNTPANKKATDQTKNNPSDKQDNSILNSTTSNTTTNQDQPAKQDDKNINDKNHSSIQDDNTTPSNTNDSRIPGVAQKNIKTSGRTSSTMQSSTAPGDAQADNVDDDSKNNLKTNTATENASTIINRNLYPINSANARDFNNKTSLNQKGFKFPDCPTIEQNAAGNKKYWEVYAGPDHTFGSYKTFGDTASNNYLQKRKETTKSSSAFSAGIRYTKVFNNGMSVRSGVNYSQINEKFKYVNPNEIRYVTIITTRVIIRSPGDTLYLNDTLQYQVTGTRAKTTYNRYRTVDIPLLIGYELGNGRIHANINAGVIINVYSWYKGDVLDSSYQPVSITTGKKSSIYQFRSNIGVGFLGSASIYYKLTDNLHLLVEPYFRYNLKPMSKDNLNLQQKIHTAGIRAGLRLDLK